MWIEKNPREAEGSGVKELHGNTGLRQRGLSFERKGVLQNDCIVLSLKPPTFMSDRPEFKSRPCYLCGCCRYLSVLSCGLSAIRTHLPILGKPPHHSHLGEWQRQLVSSNTLPLSQLGREHRAEAQPIRCPHSGF